MEVNSYVTCGGAFLDSQTTPEAGHYSANKSIIFTKVPKHVFSYLYRQINCTIFQKNVQNPSPCPGIPDAIVQSSTPTPFLGIPDAIVRPINHSDSVTITPKRRTSQNKQANKGMGKDREVGVSKSQRTKGKKTIKKHQYQPVKQPPGLLSPTQR